MSTTSIQASSKGCSFVLTEEICFSNRHNMMVMRDIVFTACPPSLEVDWNKTVSICSTLIFQHITDQLLGGRRDKIMNQILFFLCFQDKPPELWLLNYYTGSPANEWMLIHYAGREQVAHQRCRVKHGRQRRAAERRSHGWGQRERERERKEGGRRRGLRLRKHRVIHRSGDRQRKWETERRAEEKCGVHVSLRTERRGLTEWQKTVRHV